MKKTADLQVVVVQGPMFEQTRKNAYATCARIINRKLNERKAPQNSASHA